MDLQMSKNFYASGCCGSDYRSFVYAAKNPLGHDIGIVFTDLLILPIANKH